jgi:non-heme chloroperoxidase
MISQSAKAGCHIPRQERQSVSYFHTSDGTALYYSIWGTGYPVVFIHGGNVGSSSWEFQVPFLVSAGYQCIIYDQRGFARSDCPSSGYNFNTLADDLDQFVRHLQLTHFSVVTYSFGGDVLARYLSRHGAAKVDKAILVATVTPFTLKSEDNPEGMDKATAYEPFRVAVIEDRAEIFRQSLDVFFNPAGAEHPVSAGVKEWIMDVALRSSLMSMLEWYRAANETDFRDDMKSFTMPTLLIHGDADTFAPPAATVLRTHQMIPSSQLKMYPGAAHGLFFTHHGRLNRDIDAFLTASGA